MPRHQEISPGVVSDAIDRLGCLPEGWLTRVAGRLSAAVLSGREIAKVLNVSPQRMSRLLEKFRGSLRPSVRG